MINQNARDINFVLSDIAFDIPYVLEKMLLVSVKGRKSTYFKTTTTMAQEKTVESMGTVISMTKRKS